MDDGFENNLLKPINTRLWEDRIMAPDMNIATYNESYGIRQFHLVVEPIKHHILKDICINAYGYNNTTPGPVLIVKEGEWLFLTLTNNLDVPTSLMLHGLRKPSFLDRISDFTFQQSPIMPGHSHTYKLYCNTPGTYLYHSSQDFQVSMGLIGAFIVLPSDKNIKKNEVPDQDFVILLQNWEISNMKLGELIPGDYVLEKYNRSPNFFTLNGKCFPDTSPFFFKSGKRIQLRFLTKSNEFLSIHIQGHSFDLLSINGFTRTDIQDDTIELNSGRRAIIQLNADHFGNWRMNSTDIFHQSNNGVFPGGISSKIIYIG